MRGSRGACRFMGFNLMAAAAIPLDEHSRLFELRRYQVLDSDPEEAFDGLTRLACQLTQTPYALVSLTDETRQWFKARVGVTLQEIPREWAPCAHVVFERRSIVCKDMRLDARFADNPLVTGPPHVRFYAGIALVTPRGAILGTLAVMDTEPRELSPPQLEGLNLLGQQVVDQLELRAAYRDLIALRAGEKDIERRLRSERMEEAQRLAAELHDGVGQDLVGISMMLDAVLQTPAARLQAVNEPIAHATQLLRRAIGRCRQVAEGYGGFLVRYNGVVGALQHFVRSFTDTPLQIHFHGIDVSLGCIDEAMAYHLFGIGREAIANAVRHSGGNAVHVRIHHGDGHIELTVEDNGIGLSGRSDVQKRLGFSIMEYRARTIGAELRCESLEKSGLRVSCRVQCSHH
jgi:signal transduction histidine kinase